MSKADVSVPKPVMPTKDEQTVDVRGQSVKQRIQGVDVRYATTLPDERGTVCEVYRPSWDFHPDPLVYVYQVTIRPGQVKGWVVHQHQDDRIFLSFGTIKVVLFDHRPEAATYGIVDELFFSEHNRALFVIPAGVYHAIQNVGTGDAMFINLPTQPYDHADPDKYRLPLDNDLIPYRWT